MSSLLTPLIRKSYGSIDELNNIVENSNNNVNIYTPDLYEGYIHCIYVRIDLEDFSKLFTYYDVNDMLSSRKFVMYSNNKIGVLCYDNNGRRFDCEKWEYLRSQIYNYEEVDVAYSVDQFKNRMILNPEKINTLSLRYNASGNWCNLDTKLTMLIGKRVIPKYTKKDINFISSNSRRENQCVNFTSDTGIVRNIFDTQDVTEDYFLIFRSINSRDINFNKRNIRQFLCSQKLYYLMEHKTNLVEPI